MQYLIASSCYQHCVTIGFGFSVDFAFLHTFFVSHVQKYVFNHCTHFFETHLREKKIFAMLLIEIYSIKNAIKHKPFFVHARPYWSWISKKEKKGEHALRVFY